MVSSDDVVHIYRRLTDRGIRVWLTGGWGIDALLGEHTRPHKDLDILMLVDDVTTLNALLAGEGYSLKELWSENKFCVDSAGDLVATAFVLHDSAGRELDAHAFRFDAQGYAIPAWDGRGFIFSPEDLSGNGTVDRLPVACHSAQSQMICHTGYVIPDHQWPDLLALHQRLGAAYPPEITAQYANRMAG